MTAEQRAAIITAVRAHPKIGKGSLSWIDETMTDNEVIDYLDEEPEPIATPTAAVRALVEYDKLLDSIELGDPGA